MPGLAIFVVAIFATILSGIFKKVENQKNTTGTVVSLECKNELGESSKFYAYVKYEVNGNFYIVKTQNKSTAYYTGQKLKIAYNKEPPTMPSLNLKLKIIS